MKLLLTSFVGNFLHIISYLTKWFDFCNLKTTGTCVSFQGLRSADNYITRGTNGFSQIIFANSCQSSSINNWTMIPTNLISVLNIILVTDKFHFAENVFKNDQD